MVCSLKLVSIKISNQSELRNSFCRKWKYLGAMFWYEDERYWSNKVIITCKPVEVRTYILDFLEVCLISKICFIHNSLEHMASCGVAVQSFWISVLFLFFFLQNYLYSERKSKIKYIQQCLIWYFVTKKRNVKTIVNKITKQNNLEWKLSLEMKSTFKVKLK